MAEHIAVEIVVSIIKDEIRLASDEQKVALRRVLHEIRYVDLRNTHPVEPPTWIRKGDARIGKMGTTFDHRGYIITGKITAILRYQDGSERLQIVQGTDRTGTTMLWADVDDVDIL
jgi:hypothetical protein